MHNSLYSSVSKYLTATIGKKWRSQNWSIWRDTFEMVAFNTSSSVVSEIRS